MPDAEFYEKVVTYLSQLRTLGVCLTFAVSFFVGSYCWRLVVLAKNQRGLWSVLAMAGLLFSGADLHAQAFTYAPSSGSAVGIGVVSDTMGWSAKIDVYENGIKVGNVWIQSFQYENGSSLSGPSWGPAGGVSGVSALDHLCAAVKAGAWPSSVAGAAPYVGCVAEGVGVPNQYRYPQPNYGFEIYASCPDCQDGCGGIPCNQDSDGDGIPDWMDPDDDNDGHDDGDDPCPLDATNQCGGGTDTDGDGEPDGIDTDDDGDGCPDDQDTAPLDSGVVGPECEEDEEGEDCDADGVPDGEDEDTSSCCGQEGKPCCDQDRDGCCDEDDPDSNDPEVGCCDQPGSPCCDRDRDGCCDTEDPDPEDSEKGCEMEEYDCECMLDYETWITQVEAMFQDYGVDFGALMRVGTTPTDFVLFLKVHPDGSTMPVVWQGDLAASGNQALQALNVVRQWIRAMLSVIVTLWTFRYVMKTLARD